jgi:hypothetical protein
MRSSCHSLDRLGVTFDDERLVANAGLIAPASLSQHLGLLELFDQRVDLGTAPGRANVGHKAMTVIHSVLADADSIDDCDVLRAGATVHVLGHELRAPFTVDLMQPPDRQVAPRLEARITSATSRTSVTQPTPALVGEAGYPEALIPLKNGISAMGFNDTIQQLQQGTSAPSSHGDTSKGNNFKVQQVINLSTGTPAEFASETTWALTRLAA